MALLGGTKSETFRAESHVLMVGDPGLGKSQMLQACASVTPRGKHFYFSKRKLILMLVMKTFLFCLKTDLFETIFICIRYTLVCQYLNFLRADRGWYLDG